MTEEKFASPIYFFCRKCQKIVLNPKRKGDKYEYVCSVCNGEDVAFGTKEAVCDFFHIKESMFEKMLKE